MTLKYLKYFQKDCNKNQKKTLQKQISLLSIDESGWKLVWSRGNYTYLIDQ